MADINQKTASRGPDTDRADETRHPRLDCADAFDEAALSEENLVVFAELLFFAYRDFIAGPDEILGDFDFGRAHHRVLHFVNRRPGLRVADLLEILKITKQSLARVLKQLVEEDYIEQRAGTSDRRERRLFTTDKGGQLAGRLATLQAARIRRAFENASGNENDIDHTKDTVRLFLFNMIKQAEQPYVSKLLASEQPEKRRTGQMPDTPSNGADQLNTRKTR